MLKRRNIVRAVIAASVTAAAAIPRSAPATIVLGCLIAAAALAFLLFADWMVDRWLRMKAREGYSMQRFLLASVAPTLLAVGAVAAAFFALALWRLPLGTAALERFEMAAALGAGVFTIGLVTAVATHLPKRKRRPHQELLARLVPITTRELAAEAIEFQRVLGGRIAPSLAKLVLGASAISLVGILACAVLGALGVFFGGLPRDPLHVEAWPLLLKAAALLATAFLTVVVFTTALAAFRLVKSIGDSGRVRQGIVGLEAGLAFEHAGLFGTLGWGTLNLFCLALLALSAFALAGAATGADFPAPGPWQVALPLALGFAVLLVLWPQMYTLAVLTKRDCGWLHASEVGTTIIEIEGLASLRRLLLVLFWMLSVWRIPAAIRLLLESVRHYDLIVSLMLNEKSKREVEDMLQQGEAERPANLARAWKALETGRYLDALNAFQIHQHSNRNDVDSLKGEAMALLYMGNPTARERLERWERLAPDDAEAHRLVAELNSGQWSANGEKLAAAMKRCTQTIGRGV